MIHCAAGFKASGYSLRPHVKTPKCVPVITRALQGQPGGITVSTLKEAEQFFQAGIRDILYAVSIVPAKLEAVASLRKRGAEVSVVLDSMEAAEAVAAAGTRFEIGIPALIEVDCDGHRAGIRPGDPSLLRIAHVLAASPGAELRGVMTHAGSAYACESEAALRAVGEQERKAAVECAQELRAEGFPCPVVSVGSTPTAYFSESFEGVTEVRAGTHVFFDLEMVGLGVCHLEDIAISVLTTVMGHRRERIFVDAGWMALTYDRGTAGQRVDQGYGLVCDLEGRPMDDLIVVDVNQEHGVIGRRDGGPVNPLPLGTLLRILPSHCCATASQYDSYHLLDADGHLTGSSWPRFGGW